MDTVDLNNSPDLTMEQITKQLFNNEFMSDVQFYVGEKIVFAHSWELMKRSIVFRQQFTGNLGDNKLITIEDITYDAFLEFVRFIYTDECTVEENVLCEMLELARRYKVVKLETKLLNFRTKSFNTDLKLLDFGSRNKYELVYNKMFDYIILFLSSVINKDTFLYIDSNLMEEILKSNQMPSDITEAKLFDTLVRWMDKSCEIKQMPISQRRPYFDKLLQLIRFPLMTTNEFYLGVKNHPDLFTKDEIFTICQQIVLRDQCTITEFSAEPRLEYSNTYEKLSRSSNSKWVSKFIVSDNLTLHGLRFGSGYSDFEIEITGQFGIKNNTDVLRFNIEDSKTRFNTISLGESIKLKPNVEYRIEIKYKNDRTEIFCRKANVNLIVTGPSNLITFTETSKVLFEIFFKLSTN